MPLLRLYADRVFGIDTRSLAAFRISIGTIILCDLVNRSRDIAAHYTDAGVLPRSVLVEHGDFFPSWSLHAMNGGEFFQAMLFFIAAVAALCMIVGYRTRLMTVVSWVLLASLQARNVMVNNAGDALLCVMMFWAMFVPLGERWSIDRLHRARFSEDDKPVARVTSFASAALMIQLLSMYIATGLAKYNDTWWSGEALYRAMANELYQRPLAVWIVQNYDALEWVNPFTVWAEILLPLLCLSPWLTRWNRIAVILVVIAFHGTVQMAVTVGQFSFTSILCWIIFWPDGIWDWLGRFASLQRIRSAIAGAFGWLANSLPAPAAFQRPSWRAQMVASVLVAILLLFNLVNMVDAHVADRGRPNFLPQSLQTVREVLHLKRRWLMFGKPGESSGWYIVVVTLADGSRREALTDKPFDPNTYERPERIAYIFKNHRWRKFFRVMTQDQYRTLRKNMGPGCCTMWNQDHPDRPAAESIEISFISQKIMPREGAAANETKQIVFYRGLCPKPTDVSTQSPFEIQYE